MDENLTAQADFLGNMSIAMIVLWIVGIAFFGMGHVRGEAINQEKAAAPTAAAAPATP